MTKTLIFIVFHYFLSSILFIQDLEHEKYSQDEIEAIFAKLREQQVRAMEKELENQNVGQSNKRQNQLCKGSDSGNADSSNPAPETLDSEAIAAKHDALFEECCRELHVGTDDDSDGDDMRMDEDEQETSIPMKK